MLRMIHKSGVILVLLVVGCVTPQIPLPPPDIEDISFKVVEPGGNEIEISGAPNPGLAGAAIMVINNRTGYGTVARADVDGSYITWPILALDQDTLDISYVVDREASD